MLNNKKYIYCWSNDFREDSGEGKLSRLFIFNTYFNFKNKIYIRSLEGDYIYYKGALKTVSLKIVNHNNFFFKYIIFMKGVIYSWSNFLQGRKFVYLNYLPLWNFIIFFSLAPLSNLGPITGSRFNNNNFIRKYLFPIFYVLSIMILALRYKKLYFATDNLKKILPKKILNKSKFNFCLTYLKNKSFFKNKVEKNIDILIYFRDHKNKKNFFLKKFCNFFIKKKKKIFIFGDKLEVSGVKNFGFIKNSKVQSLIKQSRICINNRDNFYSFFMLECIKNHSMVLCDCNTKPYYLIKSKYILLADYNNEHAVFKKINDYLKKS